MVSLAQKLKFVKTCQKRLYKHITMVLRKKPLQQRPKNKNKKVDFKNWKKWPPCKAYRLCKMVSLAQKLKLLKTCEKRLWKHITIYGSTQKTPLTTT